MSISLSKCLNSEEKGMWVEVVWLLYFCAVIIGQKVNCAILLFKGELLASMVLLKGLIF